MIYHSRGEKSIKGLEIVSKLCYFISALIKLINALINLSTRAAISSTFLFFSLSFMFSPPKIKKYLLLKMEKGNAGQEVYLSIQLPFSSLYTTHFSFKVL